MKDNGDDNAHLIAIDCDGKLPQTAVNFLHIFEQGFYGIP